MAKQLSRMITLLADLNTQNPKGILMEVKYVL